MYHIERPDAAGRYIAMLLVFLSAIALKEGMVTNPKWYELLWLTIPMLVIDLWLIRKPRFEQKMENTFSITKEQLQ